MTIHDVTAATPLDGRRLHLRFDDGTEGTVDVPSCVPLDGVFEPLRDETYFRTVRVCAELGTVVWPNGADLDPLVLYARVTGVQVESLLAADDALRR